MKLNQAQIINICKLFSIKRLYLVGSVSRGDDSSQSDVDLLVAFNRKGSPLHQYMDTKFAFESAFQRKVDLIEENAISNPFFKKSIEEDKVLLYEEK